MRLTPFVLPACLSVGISMTASSMSGGPPPPLGAFSTLQAQVVQQSHSKHGSDLRRAIAQLLQQRMEPWRDARKARPLRRVLRPAVPAWHVGWGAGERWLSRRLQCRRLRTQQRKIPCSCPPDQLHVIFHAGAAGRAGPRQLVEGRDVGPAAAPNQLHHLWAGRAGTFVVSSRDAWQALC